MYSIITGTVMRLLCGLLLVANLVSALGSGCLCCGAPVGEHRAEGEHAAAGGSCCHSAPRIPASGPDVQVGCCGCAADQQERTPSEPHKVPPREEGADDETASPAAPLAIGMAASPADMRHTADGPHHAAPPPSTLFLLHSSLLI